MIKNFTRVVSMMCALLLASATMVWANAAQSTQNQADGQHKNHGQQRQQGTQMQTGSTNPNASGRARSRARLAQEIRHELVTLPFYDVFDWLEFEINQDGTVVTLRGQTVRPTLKSDAEARVKDIEGVAQVNNQIEVLPLSPQDNRLRLALYQTLYAFNSPLFRYATRAVPPIHIIVRNGRATLKGVVASEQDKQLAYTRARGVPGLFDVTNELVVENRQAR